VIGYGYSTHTLHADNYTVPISMWRGGGMISTESTLILSTACMNEQRFTFNYHVTLSLFCKQLEQREDT